MMQLYAAEKVRYAFSTEPIDVVIPCHPKDALQLDRCIASIRQHVQNLRRVIVVSSSPCTDKAEWVDEKIFPFSKEDVAREIFGSVEAAHYQINKPRSRVGWLYQQFLKLYAPFSIPDISSNVLIVDADVVFLQSMQFMDRYGAGVYAVGSEFNPDYFHHAGRVLPELKKRKYASYSGVVHHMLFQRPVLEDLFSMIQQRHSLEPWVAIARTIPLNEENNVAVSAMSEYEIYFNFVFSRTDQVKIRHVRWTNAFSSEHKSLDYYIREGYAYVAIHAWE
jgi:hypothetical protein